MANTLQPLVRNYEHLKRLYTQTYEEIAQLRDRLPNLKVEEVADAAMVLKRIADFADDLRKESIRVMQHAERLACAVWANNLQTEPIRGEYVTATPDIKYSASLPKQSQDPKAYSELMDFMGVGHELVDTGLLTLHWPKFTEWLSVQIAEGKPLPPGVDPEKLYPVYKLKKRKTKEPCCD